VKTEALCPTCKYPFSLWNLVFAFTPVHLYCGNCHWRIDIKATKFMWAEFAGLTAISLILAQFIVAHNWSRLLVLGVLWIILIVILDITIALLMVNLARISKPDRNEIVDVP
jgi:prepilin signal peptidase PulO-like enzyme (type II secretory pathway)